MKNINKLWIVPVLLLAATGCNRAGTQTGSVADGDAGINQVPSAPASVSDPAEPNRAFLRAVHTVRGAGQVALAIDGEKVVTDLAFGEASGFVGVEGEKVKIHATEDHQITVLGTDGKAVAGPLALDLERGEDVTVVIGGAPGKITLTPFAHISGGASADYTKVAVLHADKALPEVKISIDGENLPGDIGYGEVTSYRKLTPGAHTLKVMYDKSHVGMVDIDRKPGISPPPPIVVKANNLVTLTQPLDVEDGKVYSVILYADAGGLPKLRFVEDKFGPALIRAPDADAAAGS